jgi:hypothetical protein
LPLAGAAERPLSLLVEMEEAIADGTGGGTGVGGL